MFKKNCLSYWVTVFKKNSLSHWVTMFKKKKCLSHWVTVFKNKIMKTVKKCQKQSKTDCFWPFLTVLIVVDLFLLKRSESVWQTFFYWIQRLSVTNFVFFNTVTQCDEHFFTQLSFSSCKFIFRKKSENLVTFQKQIPT